jgi:hypothetical protein
MIYPNYVKQSPVLGLTSGAAGGVSLSYFTHTASSGGGGVDNGGSLYFDGDGDYLEVTKSTDFDFGSAFTIEAWVYANSLTTNGSAYDALDSIFESIDWNSQNGQYSFGISHENKVYFYIFDGSNDFYYGTTVLSTQQWYHLAVSRDGSGNIRLFVNGQLESTNSNSYSLSNSNQPNPARIGGCKINNSGSGIQKSFDGSISNLHIVKGTTLYTSNFTPSSTPLTAVTNTKLLCCKSTTSVTDADVIPGSGTITANGDPEASSSNPFGAGSVSFDGSGDYLTIPSSSDLTFGTGDFTVEMWVYADNFNNRNTFYDSRPSGGTTGLTIGSEVSTGQLKVYMNASGGSDQIVDTTDFSAGLWHHIAVTCASGSVRLFVNGVLKDTGTGRNLSNTNAVNIGYKTYTSSSYDYMDGRISNFRAIKGTALYTSNFTPPTSALTDVTNTKLLCCQTEGPATAAVVTPGTITSNGDPAGSTSSPFIAVDGGGSLYLDGSSVVKITSDSAAASIFNIPSSTAFTIEAWVYPTSFGSYNNIMSGWDSSCSYQGVLFHVLNSGQIFFGGLGGSTYSSNASSPVTLNNWHHVAVTRNNGGDCEFFIDGVSAGTFSNSNAANNHGCGVFIGANMDGSSDGSGGQYRFTGYISNLRYVVGHETYTSGFTPSHEPLTTTSQGVPASACKFLACQDETSIDTNSISVPMTADYGTPLASGKNPFGAVSSGGAADTSGSVLLDGTDDYIIVPDDADLELGNSDFTIEAFIKPTGSQASGFNNLFTKGWELQAYYKSDGALKLYSSTTGSSYDIISDQGLSAGSISLNTWQHVAICRSGNTWKIFVDGVQGYSASHSGTIGANASGFAIGDFSPNAGQYEFQGYISNFRVIKGTALYTSNFTAPTSPLTNVTNTKLLCCQSPTSATAAAVTPGTITSNGNPEASSSTPFINLPSSTVFYASGQDFTDRGPNAYTITNVGSISAGNNTSKSGNGSFRLDGGADPQYFYAGNNTFLNDSLSSWQFQCWARYDSGTAGNASYDMGCLIDQYDYASGGNNGRLLFGFQDNELAMRVNGGTIELTSGTQSLSNNTWYHVLLNWDGTTHRLFVDGIMKDSSTTVPAVMTSVRTGFGGGGNLNTYNLHGYMEHVLVEQGGTVKTSNFTPNNNGFVS